MKEMKKLIVVFLTVLMVFQLCACNNKEDKTKPAEEPVVMDDLPDESDEEYFNEGEDFDGNEDSGGETVETAAAVEEDSNDTETDSVEADTVDSDAGEADSGDTDTEADEGQISFQEVRESYDSLVDVYNEVNQMYQNDLIPKNENFEKLTGEISAEMDKIAALNESDVPTDEDKLEVLKRIGELDDALGKMIDSLFETAAEEEARIDQMADIVKENYEYMEKYYNTVWDYFAENGGSNEQIQVLVQARDEIGEMGDLSMKSMDDLKEFNERIDHVTSLLDALAAST